jgi:hypothetical protein
MINKIPDAEEIGNDNEKEKVIHSPKWMRKSRKCLKSKYFNDKSRFCRNKQVLLDGIQEKLKYFDMMDNIKNTKEQLSFFFEEKDPLKFDWTLYSGF